MFKKTLHIKQKLSLFFAIICGALLPFMSYTQDNVTQSQITSLLPDMFLSELQGTTDPMIIDVRDKGYFKKYKIEGAIHAANKAQLFSITDTLDKDEPVFLYCQVGYRSAQASKLLEEKGFTDIINLKKGIRNWKKEKYPVVKINKHERKKYE